MTDFAIQIDRIAISSDKVQRRWEALEDGSFIWRKRADVAWKIEHPNAWPKPEKPRAHRPMVSIEGVAFFPYEQSITLDDFVLLRDAWRYCHIGTGLTFTARQINKQIFKDRAAWPMRVGIEERKRPSAWIHKYNRVEDTRRFNVVRGALHNVAA